MELTFNTKSYKTLVNKSATVYSNDLSKSQVKIYVSAKVDSIPDATIPISWEPRQVLFTREDTDFDVVLKNSGAMVLNLGMAGDVPEELAIDGQKSKLQPGEEMKLRLRWMGGFLKENFERSVTFVADDINETRFSIPVVVEGTNPTPKAVPTSKASAGRTTTPPVKKTGPGSEIEKSSEDSDSQQD